MTSNVSVLACRGTSFQNGKAERAIGTLFAKIRTFLHDAKLPTVFWAESFACAVYMHNRTPGSDGRSPFERRHGSKPKISHLRPFGTGCCINVPTDKRKGKLVSAAIPGIMVGYGYVDGKKGYRVYVPTTRKVITSYDVTFNTLSASLQERRAAQPHLVTTPSDIANMLEELQDLTLFQTEQDYLEAPTTTVASAREPELTDKGGTSNTISRSVHPASAAPSEQEVKRPRHTPEKRSNQTEPSPGYTYLSDDDPFFDEPGIHEEASVGPAGPVSARTRSARRAADGVIIRNVGLNKSTGEVRG